MPEQAQLPRHSPVSRVVDYEPPVCGGPPILPSTVSPLTRRTPAAPTPGFAGPADPGHAAAATFADATLRRVLEVLDRRRPLAQLRPLLATGLVDSLLTGPARRTAGAARLRRVVTQPSRPDGTAAEVAANYSRGDRVYAIACRVEQSPTPTGPRWQVVALHMG